MYQGSQQVEKVKDRPHVLHAVTRHIEHPRQIIFIFTFHIWNEEEKRDGKKTVSGDWLYDHCLEQ